MATSSPALMAVPKTGEVWVPYREKITRLYLKNTLSKVMAIMERDHNFKASERQYKHRLSIWGVSKNNKGEKELQMESEDTSTSENPSVAVSSEGDAVDLIASTDLSIPPGVKTTGQKRVSVSQMSQARVQHESDAQNLPEVRNELVSLRTTTSSNPEPGRSTPPPMQGGWPNDSHRQVFNASASLPTMAALPVFADSYDELAIMGITTAVRDGSSQAAPAPERPSDTDVGQSFGSSNKSSGTINSNPTSVYNLVEGEYIEPLF